MCVRERGNVTVCMRERGNVTVCVRERERGNVTVCVRERGDMAVCVRKREGEQGCTSEYLSVCVRAEWETERKLGCVGLWVREFGLIFCAYVCVREGEGT